MALFFGIGAVEAASLVPESRRASAIALMFTGLTLANVLGVPIGTAIGQFAGWRMTFWAVSLIGVAAFVSLWYLLPQHKHSAKAPDMMREFAVLKGPVWFALTVTILSSAAMFALFTYIAPILNNLTHLSPRGVTYTLFLVGLGLTIGNILGGRLADWRLTASLCGLYVCTALVLASFWRPPRFMWWRRKSHCLSGPSSASPWCRHYRSTW